MTVSELKAQLVSNNLDRRIFVFYGDEYVVQQVYIHKLAEVTNSEIQYIDSVGVIAEDSGDSLFSTTKCYVCLDDDKLIKSINLEQDYAKLEQILGSNYLILQFSKVDKRSKFLNFVKEQAVEFEHMHPVVLERHLREQADILPQTAKILMEVCEYDYGRCLLELDKVKNYPAESQNLAFKQLLESGVIYEPPGDKIFDFAAAVLAGNAKLSFKLLESCKDIGEPALRLLLVLFTNIRHLLQVQSCDGDVAKITGLESWEIRNVQRYQGVYRNGELVKALHLIQQVETGIKTGKIDEQIAVEYVLVNFM